MKTYYSMLPQLRNTAVVACALLVVACNSSDTPMSTSSGEQSSTSGQTLGGTGGTTTGTAESTGGDTGTSTEKETDTVANNSAPVACGSDPAQLEIRMLTLVNEIRATARQCGDVSFEAASAVSWDSRLAVAATEHSMDMANTNFFSHTGSNGSSVSQRITDQGYQWSSAAENIANNVKTTQEAVNNWLASDFHCSNMMGPKYVNIAAACVENASSDATYYWTLKLASPL